MHADTATPTHTLSESTVQSALSIFKMFHWYVWLVILGTHVVTFGGMLLFDVFHNGYTATQTEPHYIELL